MTTSIVCGIDDSHGARLALRTAARIAEALDARLLAAHVVQTPAPPPELGSGALPVPAPVTARDLEGGRALLERVLLEEDVPEAERRVLSGFPPEALADLADEVDAELVVVGSRGRGRLRAALLGSVSLDLIAVSRRPVVVVPQAATAARLRRGRTAEVLRGVF